jgi:hypothetical protein
MVIVGFQILSQTFTHDKIKTGLSFVLGLMMTKKLREFHIPGQIVATFRQVFLPQT